jgi:Pectate lyase superfamily protein
MNNTTISRLKFLRLSIGSFFFFVAKGALAAKAGVQDSGNINHNLLSFDTFKQRPGNLGVHDVGVEYVFNETGSIHQWTGETWHVLADRVNVRDYGAVGNGVVDDTNAIQSAANVAVNGLLLYFPIGVYATSAQVVLPSDIGGMIGDNPQNTIITSSIVQTVRVKSSFIVMRESNGSIFKDFQLKYLGKFDTGKSYSGFVEGLHIFDSSNIVIDNLEVSGFNSSGIRLDGKKKITYDNISKNNKVQNCYLHHNRVAGLALVWQDGTIVTNNVFERNGLSGDYGTGYGFACGNSSIIKNITVTYNITKNNYRKGLDCHEIENLLMTNNTCIADGLFGIFVGNTLYPMGETIIENNSIICDPDFIPKVRPIEYYTGIFYLYSDINTKGKNIRETLLRISNNKISGVGRGNRSVRGLTVHGIKVLNFCKKMSSIIISGNHIEGTNFNAAIDVSMNYPVFAKYPDVLSKGMKCNIIDNRVEAKEFSDSAINIDYYDSKNLGNLGEVLIQRNNIAAEYFTKSVVRIKRGFQLAVLESNNFSVLGKNRSSIEPIIDIEKSVNGTVGIQNNNITSLSTLRNPSIKYGGNRLATSLSLNRLNGMLLPPSP